MFALIEINQLVIQRTVKENNMFASPRLTDDWFNLSPHPNTHSHPI